MTILEKQQASYAEFQKTFTSSQIVEDTESMLHAPMGSNFPTSDSNQIVKLRFIELTGSDTAIIRIYVAFKHYSSTTVSRDVAFANADLQDIVVENGQFKFISNKIVSDTDKPVELVTHELPPFTPEAGEKNEIALYAPKNTSILIKGVKDKVAYRVRYDSLDDKRKFVIKTFSGAVYEHDDTEELLAALEVPGDFSIFQGRDYVNLLGQRAMYDEHHMFTSFTPIVLPKKS